MRAPLVLASLVSLGACIQESPSSGGDVASRVATFEAPIGTLADMDVLFVIDSSLAMASEQPKLLENYRLFAQSLVTVAGDAPNLHIGVVTADPADAGALHQNRFIADTGQFAWQRTRNYDGTLPDSFTALANVGSSGSAEQHPLAMIEAALTTNPGLVRSDAYLAVVILTASDDHGSDDVMAVANKLKAIKSDPTKVIVGAALPCNAESPRLQTFLAQFPHRNMRASLCDDDLRSVVASISQMYKVTLGLPCFERPLATPHECVGELVDTTTAERVEYPMCTATRSTRCWTPKDNIEGCPDSGVSLSFVPRPAFAATASIQCLAAD